MSQELNLDALKREAEILRSFKAWRIIDRLVDRIRELEHAQPAREAEAELTDAAKEAINVAIELILIHHGQGWSTHVNVLRDLLKGPSFAFAESFAIETVLREAIDRGLGASRIDEHYDTSPIVDDIARRVMEALAAPPAAANQAGKTVDELAMMIRLLVHALRKAAPANPLSVRAMDYLERHGLQGSVLRAAPTESQARGGDGE